MPLSFERNESALGIGFSIVEQQVAGELEPGVENDVALAKRHRSAGVGAGGASDLRRNNRRCTLRH